MAEMTGGCACGKVRYSVEIDNDDAYLCHCRMCQRATGGVSIAFKNLPKAAVHWEREPDYFHSSPIARRGYYAACGTPLTFEYPDSDKMDLRNDMDGQNGADTSGIALIESAQDHRIISRCRPGM